MIHVNRLFQKENLLVEKKSGISKLLALIGITQSKLVNIARKYHLRNIPFITKAIKRVAPLSTKVIGEVDFSIEQGVCLWIQRCLF
ncbi:MAG: hypothetical protein DRN04_19130 [Thermoprotei archaeon]|nr:MAG: hypothetical protein DRN04_19130 [Thermoprotei archaeon]